jgi:hypothetical protein
VCSFSEQKEVEDHFTKTLFFIPECHKGYWIGYKATSWPNFQPMVGEARGSEIAAAVNMP